MAKMFARLGTSQTIGVCDFRMERRDYLSVYSFQIPGKPYRPAFARCGDSVSVLPVDRKRRQLFLIQQPRPMLAFAKNAGIPKWTMERVRGEHTVEPFVIQSDAVMAWEAPGGMIDEGEAPAEAARRELTEETGLVVREDALTLVQDVFPSVGVLAERTSLFFAWVSAPYETVPLRGDGTEEITVWRMSFDEAFTHLKEGKITSPSAANLLRELRVRELEKTL